MKTVIFTGKVAAGEGGGTRFLRLPWVKKQVIEKLGFIPYPGTLNLRLSEESIKKRKELNEIREVLTITPVRGYCCGLCFKARIMDKIDGAVVVPQTPDYHEDLLEIIAPVSLRETLELREGDEVQITVYLRPPPQ